MVDLLDLWIPILVSGALVFVASSVIHMCLPIHKGDYKKLPGEEELLSAMKGQGVERGQYMFPMPPSMKEMNSPQMIEKYERGPVGYMVVLPSGAPGMGKSLVQWFVYTLVISVFVAYLATLMLDPGAHYGDVFRITSTVAFLGYGVGVLNDSIWKGVSWRITLKHVFDGAVYALVTAGVFGWLWPPA
jgi:hypothetical protein